MRRRPKHDTSDLEWHHDGDITGAEMDCGIVVWSSSSPTLIKDKNGQIWVPNGREVIYFRNREVLHRRPPDVARRRWLWRQRVR